MTVNRLALLVLTVLALLVPRPVAAQAQIVRWKILVYIAGTTQVAGEFFLDRTSLLCGQERPLGANGSAVSNLNPKKIFFREPPLMLTNPSGSREVTSASGFYCIWQEGPSGPISILPRPGAYELTAAAVLSTGKRSLESPPAFFRMEDLDVPDPMIPVPVDVGVAP